MTLATYISDLLYRYDCVIVPDFGGFITKRMSAQIKTENQTFYPPSKQLGFNHHLTHNDGLLASHVAAERSISFENANRYILEQVQNWNDQLKTEKVVLEKIGSIFLNGSNQLVFEPNTELNYLTDSFGLSAVKTNTIARPTAKVVAIDNKHKNKTTIPAFIKYAATAAIVMTLAYSGYNGYYNNKMQEDFAKKQQKLEDKIQSATFTINQPLPTIDLTVTKEKPKPYHVIAGAFQLKENANKKLNQLKKLGFDATILGVNKWGLTQVAYASYYNKYDAFKTLASVRKTDSKDAWLLVKKFD